MWDNHPVWVCVCVCCHISSFWSPWQVFTKRNTNVMPLEDTRRPNCLDFLQSIIIAWRSANLSGRSDSGTPYFMRVVKWWEENHIKINNLKLYDGLRKSSLTCDVMVIIKKVLELDAWDLVRSKRYLTHCIWNTVREVTIYRHDDCAKL
jgi:hypothetical protein